MEVVVLQQLVEMVLVQLEGLVVQVHQIIFYL